MTALHDLKLKTLLSFERVEDLLGTCCTKLYSLTLDGIEESSSGQRKVLRISFEDPNDRERFRQTFQKSREDSFTPALPPTLQRRPAGLRTA